MGQKTKLLLGLALLCGAIAACLATTVVDVWKRGEFVHAFVHGKTHYLMLRITEISAFYSCVFMLEH